MKSQESTNCEGEESLTLQGWEECQKNELFTIFLDKILSLYNRGEYSELEKILIGHEFPNRTYKYAKNTNGATYIDDETIVDRRLWLNNESKKCLDILYYVCKDTNIKVKINSAIIKLWIFQQNTEMEKFFNDVKRAKVKLNRDVRTEIIVENGIWDEIIKKSRLMGISVNESFALAINLYLEQKAKMYL